MEKDSALYQLMNGIVSGDGEYHVILRKSDIYSGELDGMDLSKEIRQLIERYISEHPIYKGIPLYKYAYIIYSSRISKKLTYIFKFQPQDHYPINLSHVAISSEI